MLDYTVTSINDAGRGSLRDAIERANANGSGRITFAIGHGPLVLRPSSPLPPIAFSGEIDCRSQPGYAGSPIVEFSGAAVDRQSESAGLEIVSSGLIIRGAAVTDWPANGVHVHHGRSNALLGFYAGLRLDGITAGGNGLHGVFLDHSIDNQIGAAGSEALFVGSWNKLYGVWLKGAHGATISNARLGTDAAGRAAAPNGSSGVRVFNCEDVVVGGRTDQLTVISGNTRYGIEFAGGDTRRCRLNGSHVGCDATGIVALPNGRSGVLIYNTPNIQIGGLSTGEANLISGNARAGVSIDGAVSPAEEATYSGSGNANGNHVVGNLIGCDATGEKPLGNGLRAVLINFAQRNVVDSNVLAGSGQDGVLILGPADDGKASLVASDNRIVRNRIGVSKNGARLGISRHGVYVQHGRDNIVGGSHPDEANIIRHCAKRGVVFRGAGWDSNVLGPENDISDNGLGAFYAAP